MNHHRLFVVNVVVLAALALGCGRAPIPRAHEVASIRQSSEQLAKLASKDLADRPERLHALEGRYRELALAGNQYLSEVQGMLGYESLLEDQRRPQLEKQARIVASRYAAFVLEADAGRTTDAFVVVGARLGEVVDQLVDELDALLEAREEQSRKAVIAHLEEVKWKPWDQVAEAPSRARAAAETPKSEEAEAPKQEKQEAPPPASDQTSCRAL